MEIKKMIAELKKNWLVSAVICILAGLVLVIWPVETLHSACYVLGGIAIAAAAGVSLGVPVLFAKKHQSSNVDGEVLAAKVHSLGSASASQRSSQRSRHC